jgi:hypothetical protein
MSAPGTPPAATRARQRRTLTLLAWGLIVAGAAVLAFLDRMPLPARVFTGLGDIIAGCVLLLVRRQKFGA